MWVIGRFYALMIQEIIKDLCILQPWRGRNHVVIRHVYCEPLTNVEVVRKMYCNAVLGQ